MFIYEETAYDRELEPNPGVGSDGDQVADHGVVGKLAVVICRDVTGSGDLV
jgi:hypothetical protein